MKPALMTCLSALAALSLTGCPIYPSDNLCRSDWDCAEGYLCIQTTGACVLAGPVSCTRPTECAGPSEVCSSAGVCMVGSCHLREVGCVAGYSCVGRGPEMAWTCVPTQEADTGSVGGAPAFQDAGAGGTVITAAGSSAAPDAG